jgi:hypothetical protein
MKRPFSDIIVLAALIGSLLYVSSAPAGVKVSVSVPMCGPGGCGVVTPACPVCGVVGCTCGPSCQCTTANNCGCLSVVPVAPVATYYCQAGYVGCRFSYGRGYYGHYRGHYRGRCR